MPEMHADHEETVVAYDGVAPFRGAPVDRAILPDYVAIPDFHAALDLSLESQILRYRPQDRSVADKIAGPHLYRSFDDHVRLDDALIPDDRALTDDRIGTDLHLSADLGARLDNRGRMNLHSTPASLKLK
jgi:hypothetical protein